MHRHPVARTFPDGLRTPPDQDGRDVTVLDPCFYAEV
jgi:hypothetical protein